MVVNGVTVEPGNEAIISGNAYFFASYALSSATYVYNNAGEQTAQAGWVPCGGANPESGKTIQYNIVNPSGTVTLSIYGKVGIGTAETLVASITSASATSGFVTVTEMISEMRIGLKISAGAATVSVTGNFKGMQFSA